ncbi:hypothetical protein FDJ44_gp59 [Microbacterium phage Pikmin]|uniref:Uncharacterized protein n=1 Tax=Microbacterium phage Pikmin TaxID=2099444 RepID=A0A2P1CIT9_9CAUD|nr:hypothetical protein FDJ44_gp59 [Microbacterium phage Pikmin]AVJ51197.1 hypothetical protein PBI_PIKMIN_59 [Microbacterium phage Pikmin]
MADTRQMPVVNRPDGVVPVCRVRVAGTFRIIDGTWAEVTGSIQLREGNEWLSLNLVDHPLIVARRFSGNEGDREVPELTVVAAVKRGLGSGGAEVLQLTGSEARSSADGRSTEWRYWAWMGARLSVALQTRGDGSVVVLGLQ